jgi:hypothetical protein
MALERKGRWSERPPLGPRRPSAATILWRRIAPRGRQARGGQGLRLSQSDLRSGQSQRSKRQAGQQAFVLPLAVVTGLVLSASSLSLLGVALASHQAQASEHRRRQADDGLHDLAQLLAKQLVGHRPEELNPASLGPDLLALALPAGWQLGGLQWQPSEPSDPGLVTLQVTLNGRGGERRKGLVHFDRSLPDGLIRALHQVGA